VVWFADASKAIAVLAISDHLKSSSAAAVAQLREMGITAYMLTGDSADSAREIARQTGITHFHSGVLPQYKADFVKQLQSEGHRVAMVGDGINDSAALAQANLSIAMGQGSDIAMETAMVTILRSDLCAIATAIHLSKATVRTIHENLFWAFIYNLIAVPIAAGVLYPAYGFLLNPMIGGAAMAFSSVSVVLNSLRLKTRRVVSPLESFTQDGDGTHGDVTDYQSITDHIMKKEFKVSGMMCQHCRAHVENALNSIEGVKAVVTLEPAVASVEFTGAEKSLEELQQVVSEKAGSDYILSL
jgi:Cu2+-exporting ATPase